MSNMKFLKIFFGALYCDFSDDLEIWFLIAIFLLTENATTSAVGG